MQSLFFLLAAAVCFFAAILLIRKEPRRIVNGVLLETGVVLVVCATVFSAKYGQFRYTAVEVAMWLMYGVIFLTGIALLIDFFVITRREGKTIANFLPLPFGVLALLVGVLGYRELTSGLSGSETYVRVMSVLYNIALYAPYAIGAVLLYSIVYLHLPKQKNPKYLIVLGCSLRKNGEVSPLLRGRVDKAIAWYRAGGETAKFVVSGGQGADEVISEAQAMKNYLLTQHIPENAILLEDRSVNTRENLLYSQQRIAEDGGGNALICTSNYHVLRAVILARKLGVDAQGIGGHTALYYLPVAFLREYIAVIFQYKALILLYLTAAIVLGLWM